MIINSWPLVVLQMLCVRSDMGLMSFSPVLMGCSTSITRPNRIQINSLPTISWTMGCHVWQCAVYCRSRVGLVHVGFAEVKYPSYTAKSTLNLLHAESLSVKCESHAIVDLVSASSMWLGYTALTTLTMYYTTPSNNWSHESGNSALIH